MLRIEANMIDRILVFHSIIHVDNLNKSNKLVITHIMVSIKFRVVGASQEMEQSSLEVQK